jgi:hypothetical protein
MESIPLLPEEKFVKINDYDNYFISNMGRLYNSNTKKFSTGSIHKSGYVNVYLSKKSVMETFALHRMVAEYFIPNPENKPCVII